MGKFVSLIVAMHLFLAGGAFAEGLLQHHDCRLKVSKRVSTKRKYIEARNALLQRGYVLITDKSGTDIVLHRPSTMHPAYRLEERAHMVGGDDDSSLATEKRLLWEGQAENFPYCKIIPNARTLLIRAAQYPVQVQMIAPTTNQCVVQGPTQNQCLTDLPQQDQCITQVPTPIQSATQTPVPNQCAKQVQSGKSQQF